MSPPPPYILLFDGVCGLCSSVVHFAFARDPERKIFYAPLQSEYGRERAEEAGVGHLVDDLNTVIFIERIGDGPPTAYVKSAAALRCGSLLSFPVGAIAALLYALVPRFIGDFGYDIVAANRYTVFGKSECALVRGLSKQMLVDPSELALLATGEKE
jgi:predicted DCC family thiol-disulfide oxidoreductase YuxK